RVGSVVPHAPVWPSAASAVVVSIGGVAPVVPVPDGGAVPASRVAMSARPGGLPVVAGPAAEADSTDSRAPGESPGRVVVSAPRSVTVSVAPHDLAVRAGVSGVVLSVARADGVAESGRVRLAVDGSGFGEAFGGDFVNRLRL